MYRPIPREQITDALIHLRGLFRQVPTSSEKDDRANEKREILTKNLLSNLNRTGEHPTLHVVLEVADVFSLTLDGAHRLFGYELEHIREYDLALNGGRTHIIETYPFERDRLIDLPSHFGGDEIFARNATARDLISDWHTNVPIRTLETGGWEHPGAFYVCVGTEDSLGSSLPPGALALVVPVEQAERSRPDPRAIYLLQFGNGYRCSRCVVTRNKLILLSSRRRYDGPQEFAYPSGVRIAGRIRMFALGLPAPNYPSLRPLPLSQHNAPLILPWEHSSMDHLFRAKHRRFRRSRQDIPRIREAMEAVFHTKLSGRTERRYRWPTSSLPHVDTLIQLAITHVARYSDVLLVQRVAPSDRGRYSLDTLLHSQHLQDLPAMHRRPYLPVPADRWTKVRKEYVEWPAPLSLRFPRLQALGERIIRLSQGIPLQGLDPPIAAGSLILLEKTVLSPDIHSDEATLGWGRRVYALVRGTDLLCGYLDRDGQQYALNSGAHGTGVTVLLREAELHQLRHVSGVAVPV